MNKFLCWFQFQDEENAREYGVPEDFTGFYAVRRLAQLFAEATYNKDPSFRGGVVNVREVLAGKLWTVVIESELRYMFYPGATKEVT